VAAYAATIPIPMRRAHPSQLHSQQRTLAQHDMLPQHPVYRNELNCECFNVTLATKKRSSLRMISGSKHVAAILSVLCEIIEVHLLFDN